MKEEVVVEEEAWVAAFETLVRVLILFSERPTTLRIDAINTLRGNGDVAEADSGGERDQGDIRPPPWELLSDTPADSFGSRWCSCRVSGASGPE